MRIEPDIGVDEFDEFDLAGFEEVRGGPVNRETGSGCDIGRRDLMDDLRLIRDVVDAELNPVRDATGSR